MVEENDEAQAPQGFCVTGGFPKNLTISCYRRMSLCNHKELVLNLLHVHVPVPVPVPIPDLLHNLGLSLDPFLNPLHDLSLYLSLCSSQSPTMQDFQDNAPQSGNRVFGTIPRQEDTDNDNGDPSPDDEDDELPPWHPHPNVTVARLMR
ncbi:hypothetical protein PM082_023524 [Marasmius tenuissimus]|nr:hypothetical protein PM082_023524 [Marasmius tenuissimus]